MTGDPNIAMLKRPRKTSDPRVGAIQVGSETKVPKPPASRHAIGAERGEKPRELEPIGIGKPLRIQFLRVYAGQYRWSRRVLITSQTKNPSAEVGGARCMNLFSESIRERAFIEWRAGRGSQIVYYSPSESEERLQVAIEVNYDSFDVRKARKWIDAGTEIAGLPAFLGAGVSGQAVVRSAAAGARLIVNLVDRIIDNDAADDIFGFEVNVIGDVFGGIGQAGYVLLTPPTDADPNDPWYGTPEAYAMEPDTYYNIRGKRLAATGGALVEHEDADREFLGEFPYVLLRVDGHKEDKLKNWKPAKVAASIAA